MDDSILKTIKAMLGIPLEYEVFDPELVVFINSALTTLNQLGVGPEGGYKIAGVGGTWSDILPEDTNLYENVKTYVYLRVRVVFDPPPTSYVLDAFNKEIKEHEWRITVRVDEDSKP